MTQEQPQPQPQSGNGSEAQQFIGNFNDTMSQFLAAASVDAVYGEPLHDGETTVIPCAEVLSIAGFGGGYGTGTPSQGAQSEGAESQGGQPLGTPVGGGGGGGGGWVLSRPVAVIEISPNGVTVKPIIDVTKLGIAAITTWGFMLTVAMRMMRGRR
jgi:uncharacterized spore protein YtfJ